MRITEDLHTRFLKLHTHADGEQAADDSAANGEDQVHRSDVLMVGGINPPLPSGRRVIVVRSGFSSLCHYRLLLMRL